MDEVGPGIHPKFDMTRFSVPEQRALRRLSQSTHLNRDGEVILGNDTKFRYALIRPSGQMRGLLHTDREVMVVFSDYPEFQSRTLDAFDRVLASIPDEFRVEKVARILVSHDREVAGKVKKLFQSKPDAPVVIPFCFDEMVLATKDHAIASRIREFTYSRDLFSMSSPLRGDLYFYGRSGLINEICSKLASGENFGLFGLRRSGKTSIVNGLSRAVGARSGKSIIIDCQNPAVHQRRWFELLEHIARTAKETFNSTAIISKSDKYTEKDASNTFVRDMRAIKSNSRAGFISLLFDEIERIGFGTASSKHWNEERDFLHFWQAIRFGFQSENAPYSFLIVGTNPSTVERIKIFESDNPLFGNVEKRFIPMFTPDQVNEMVDDLGSIMGVHFDQASKANLHSEFGGHPFLTRYACSYIANASKLRPLEVDRTIYSQGVAHFSIESDSYVDSIVGLLRDEYPDEFEMLRYLGSGDKQSFCYLADSDPALAEHLLGYGVVQRGTADYYFRIGLVEKYFEQAAIPTHLLTAEDRLAEISARRNAVERKLRSFVGQAMRFAYHANARREAVFSKLQEARRKALAEKTFDDLFDEGASPLYFDEIKSIILSQWTTFQNVLEMDKGEFEYHMNTVNRLRADAHAKDISDADFDRWRVSISEIETRIDGR